MFLFCDNSLKPCARHLPLSICPRLQAFNCVGLVWAINFVSALNEMILAGAVST